MTEVLGRLATRHSEEDNNDIGYKQKRRIVRCQVCVFFYSVNARKYAGVFVFSGALIGPLGMPRNYPGSFDNIPVFIGGSDVDPWLSYDLIKDTAKVFKKMGANVDLRTYPGMDHMINQDEIDRVRTLLVKANQYEKESV